MLKLLLTRIVPKELSDMEETKHCFMQQVAAVDGLADQLLQQMKVQAADLATF